MTPTPCPDEDTYARFLQGILPVEHIAAIERHIDTCARCAELGAQFGKLYGTAGPEADEPTQAARRPSGTLLVVELVMLALHAIAAVTVLPAALGLISTRAASTLTVAAAGYAAIWVPLGGALAASAAWALWRGRRWGVAIARAHAIASFPSIVLTPLAAFVLQQTGPGERRRG